MQGYHHLPCYGEQTGPGSSLADGSVKRGEPPEGFIKAALRCTDEEWLGIASGWQLVIDRRLLTGIRPPGGKTAKPTLQKRPGLAQNFRQQQQQEVSMQIRGAGRLHKMADGPAPQQTLVPASPNPAPPDPPAPVSMAPLPRGAGPGARPPGRHRHPCP